MVKKININRGESSISWSSFQMVLVVCLKGHEVISCYWEKLKPRTFGKEIFETIAIKSKLWTTEQRVVLPGIYMAKFMLKMHTWKDKVCLIRRMVHWIFLKTAILKFFIGWTANLHVWICLLEDYWDLLVMSWFWFFMFLEVFHCCLHLK